MALEGGLVVLQGRGPTTQQPVPGIRSSLHAAHPLALTIDKRTRSGHFTGREAQPLHRLRLLADRQP